MSNSVTIKFLDKQPVAAYRRRTTYQPFEVTPFWLVIDRITHSHQSFPAAPHEFKSFETKARSESISGE